jgi:hypothetical protein
MAILIQHLPPARAEISLPAISDRVLGAAVFFYFLGVVLPTELAINFFGLALIPVRVVLLAFFVPAVMRLARTSDFRLQSFDWLLMLGLAWLMLALMVNNGAEKGFKYGGSLVLEALGGYVLARAYVRSYAQFADAVRTYFLFVLVALAVAFPEAFLKIKFVHALASSLTGNPDIAVTSEAGRLGLERATSTFDHPIHYGVFCATSLGLVWFMSYGRPTRWLLAGVIAFATLCSVSSAPMLAYAMAVAFILWERGTRHIANRAAITLSAAAGVYLVLEVFSNRPAVEVLSRLIALDSWTAYYRVLIWQNAFVDLANHPLLGVALNAWTRPKWMTGSVDAFWLVTALTAGLPTAALLAAMVVQLLRKVHARTPGMRETRERWLCRFGWTAAVLALCMQAFTVHYWGAMHSLFFFVLGMGAWMSDSRYGLVKTLDKPAPASAAPRRMLVTGRPGPGPCGRELVRRKVPAG